MKKKEKAVNFISFIVVLLGDLMQSFLTGAPIFFNWDSLHARLNSHYKAWSYKKKNHKKN